jgi:multicomponent Na+:H+ antiporter subunit E
MTALRERPLVLFVWGAVFAVSWWMATGSSPGAWWIGVPTVSIAAAAAVALRTPAPGLRWSEMPAFLWFVLARSAVGSVDVALRSLRPKPAIAPELIDLRLRSERGAVLLATLVSLLPGTLSARLEGPRLVVHSLADPTAAEREVLALEERVARLLGEDGEGVLR